MILLLPLAIGLMAAYSMFLVVSRAASVPPGKLAFDLRKRLQDRLLSELEASVRAYSVSHV